MHQYRVSQWGEHNCSAHNKKNGDYYEYPSLSHFMDEHWLQEKWRKEKLFLQIQNINIVYPNEENMIVVPITKRIEIITSTQVCLFSWVNINYKENGGKKLFFQIQSINIVYPKKVNMIVVLNNKKKRDYYRFSGLSHFMDELCL